MSKKKGNKWQLEKIALKQLPALVVMCVILIVVVLYDNLTKCVTCSKPVGTVVLGWVVIVFDLEIMSVLVVSLFEDVHVFKRGYHGQLCFFCGKRLWLFWHFVPCEAYACRKCWKNCGKLSCGECSEQVVKMTGKT